MPRLVVCFGPTSLEPNRFGVVGDSASVISTIHLLKCSIEVALGRVSRGALCGSSRIS